MCFFKKKIVGIDIGASAIKIVELSRRGRRVTLENYGQIKSGLIQKEPLFNENGGMLAKDNVSLAIKAILDEARIKTKKAVFAMPDFLTFCASFDLPPMTEKEIPEAIRYNALQYITLPISEVTLDWKILKNPNQGQPSHEVSAWQGKNSGAKVFLTAVPNQMLQDYQNIAIHAGLQLYALEAEVFGLSKALVKNNKKTVCLIDIGAKSSTINIVDNGFLKRSFSSSFNSNQLHSADLSVFSQLLEEVRGITAEFLQQEQKNVEEFYLTGGAANMPGIKEYFTQNLKGAVSVPNCFSDMSYPAKLGQTLKELSPSFSVAVGAALGGLES